MTLSKKSKKVRRKENSGFTLLEVIVILVILAVLAAILIPTLTGYIDSGREKAAIANCRAAVNAAQTLASENYGTTKNISRAEVMELSEINGYISTFTFNEKINDSGELDKQDDKGVRNGIITHLTYLDPMSEKDNSNSEKNQITVAYCRYPDACKTHEKTYTINKTNTEEWAMDKTFAIGDTMTSNGYIFGCLRAHTTGTTSRTRNPSLRSNKSTWEVIGTTDGKIPNYSSTVRYGVGFITLYKGKLYERTTFNLVGGQVPYENRSSDYWILLGEAPEESN